METVRRVIVCGGLALVAGLGVLVSDAAAELREVQGCVEKNMPRLSTVQKMLLDVEERGENIFESKLTLYWRRLDDGQRRIALRFREPEDLARSSLLVHQRPRRRPEVYIYLPDHGKPRTISSRGELEGFLGRANLGIEEMELLLEPVTEKDLRLVEARELDGRAVWVLEERSEDEDTRYARTLSFIDQEYCIPIRAELYDQEDQLSKLLEIDPSTVKRVAESWVPQRVAFREPAEQTDTILRIEDIEVDQPLAPSLLTVESLPRLSR